LKPPTQAPRVRLVVKAKPEIQIPTAQEPPPPVISSTQSPEPAKKSKPKPDFEVLSKDFKASKALKRARFEEKLQKATELTQQHPAMSVQVGIQIVLGQFTVEDWQARRLQKNESATRKRQHFEQQERLIKNLGQNQEMAWLERFYRAQEFVWMDVAVEGELRVRLKAGTRFTVSVKVQDGKVQDGKTLLLDKTKISAICSAADSAQCALMRQITNPSLRNSRPETSPWKRWSFPHEVLQQLVGKRVGVELLNGSRWTGYVRWTNVFSFMLGAEPDGGAEVILYKHACCGLTERLG
jgi:sRNA-binding regulator protein Hfq